MLVAPSDEFFIYQDRRPNYKNDIIWALNIEDIPDEVKTRQISKHTKCIGVFLCFTAKRLMWVTKEAGQSWTGDYFRDNVLSKEVIPFLKDRRNVLSVK